MEVYYSDKPSLCRAVIARLMPSHPDYEKLCREWMETTFNICIDYQFDQGLSVWARLRRFLTNAYVTALQFKNEDFSVQPHEMNSTTCEEFMRKMFDYFVKTPVKPRQDGVDVQNAYNNLLGAYIIFSMFTLISLLIYATWSWCSKGSKKDIEKLDDSAQSEEPTNSHQEEPADIDETTVNFDEVTTLFDTDSAEGDTVTPMAGKLCYLESRSNLRIRRSERDLTDLDLSSSAKTLKKPPPNDIIKRNIELARYGRNQPKLVFSNPEIYSDDC